MNKKNKYCLIFCLYIFIMFFIPTDYMPSYAADNAINNCYDAEKEETRADSIITYYKVIYGNTYYRRWNETKGYWVDPDWIPLF